MRNSLVFEESSALDHRVRRMGPVTVEENIPRGPGIPPIVEGTVLWHLYKQQSALQHFIQLLHTLLNCRIPFFLATGIHTVLSWTQASLQDKTS